MKTVNVALARAQADADLDEEVRATVTAYLDGRTSLADLRRSLAARGWGLPRASMAAPLVFGAQLAIEEYSSGHATMEDLQGDLRRLLRGRIQVIRSTGFQGRVHRGTRRPPPVPAGG